MKGKLNQIGARMSSCAVAVLVVALIGAAVPSVTQALTPEQCNYFQLNDKVFICHHTQSPKNPFVNVLVSVDACIEGHAGHPLDFIDSVNPSALPFDPLCQGNGCLGGGAPCDVTLPCCEGLSCTSFGLCDIAPPSCDDSNPCTDDTFDDVLRVCRHTPNTGAACAGGLCVAGRCVR
jgi:hypothetical protein